MRTVMSRKTRGIPHSLQFSSVRQPNEHCKRYKIIFVQCLIDRLTLTETIINKLLITVIRIPAGRPVLNV